jgi:hypothetical protein
MWVLIYWKGLPETTYYLIYIHKLQKKFFFIIFAPCGRNDDFPSLLYCFHNQDPELLVPTLRSRYEDWPLKKVKPEIPDLSSDECFAIMNQVPKADDFPTVFVSPENRGFDLSEMFSVYVDIPLEHPAGE